MIRDLLAKNSTFILRRPNIFGCGSNAKTRRPSSVLMASRLVIYPMFAPVSKHMSPASTNRHNTSETGNCRLVYVQRRQRSSDGFSRIREEHITPRQKDRD